MNSATLDTKNRLMIQAKYREILRSLTPDSKIVVKITGWVQPTPISPNVRGLSFWRAKSVALHLQSLGLKARYSIEAPGHAKANNERSRRASVEISWSDSK
jgi:hypothetical protein